MSSDGEQEAFAKIKRYLNAGHSVEAIRDAGWGEWFDYFASKGVSLDDTQPATAPLKARPPEDESTPSEQPSAGAESKFTLALAQHYMGMQVETKGLISKRKFVRIGPLISTGTFLFETGAVLGRAMRDRLATFAYPFCGTTPENSELAGFIRSQGQAIASAAPEASTIHELIFISEMRKADPSLPAEQWNAWLLANGDAEVAEELVVGMSLMFQSSGAGFGAEFPEKFEEMFANTYKVDDPELWREAAVAGLDVPSEPPDFVSLEERTKTDLGMFAEYCAEFYPDYVGKLGLGQYVGRSG